MPRSERQGSIEFLTHTFLACVAVLIFGALISLFVALLFLLSVQPSLAANIQYPVAVPPECIDLAQREGHPLIIESRAQGIRAKARLWRLSGTDPLVKQCRDAVRAMEAANASR